jgi:hypothetical protein
MYAAKAGGKNQISGYPRPLRAASPPPTAVSQVSALG